MRQAREIDENGEIITGKEQKEEAILSTRQKIDNVVEGERAKAVAQRVGCHPRTVYRALESLKENSNREF